MKLIHGLEIKEALKEIAPRSIAVAYLGKDWSKYIDVNRLQNIVLSPTLGSNPSAIMEVVRHLGWDNVHFLDNLHAKIYIGASMAAVGSFNLTANGLSAEGLEEAGFVVQDQVTLDALRDLVDTYQSAAKEAYPKTSDKVAAVEQLRSLWDRAIRTGAIRNDGEASDIASVPLTTTDEVYVCWAWGNLTHSDNVVSPSTISQELSFLEEDDVRPDRWILCWQCRNDYQPNEGSKPYWMHIDEVLSEGAIDSMYTKLAIERNDRCDLAPPFEISDQFTKAFRKVLKSGRFPEFLGKADESWSITPTLSKLPAFFDAIRNEMAEDAKQADPAAPISIESLRQAFAQRIREAMEISVRKGYVTSKIEALLARKHAVEVAKDLVKPGSDTKPGLKKLAKAKALHLSFESHMLESQFRPLFNETDLELARWNLREVDPSYTPPP